MTAATASPTTLAPVPGAALKLAQGGKFSVADLADAVRPPVTDPKVPDFPALPKPVTLTDAARQAVGRVSKVFGKFHLTEARPLTAPELEQLTDEARTIADAVGPLQDRSEAIAEMIRVHMDRTAERDAAQDGGTPLRRYARILAGKAKGHLLRAAPGTPYKVAVNGFEQCWEQRYVTGKAEIQPAKLQTLLDAGKITRAEFLAFTREVRAYDEDKVAAFVRKDPARGLEILAAITTRRDPSAQLVSPKQ